MKTSMQDQRKVLSMMVEGLGFLEDLSTEKFNRLAEAILAAKDEMEGDQ